MALTRGRLSNVTAIAGAANANVVTVANNKKVYVKSIVAYSPTGSATTAHVYVVPNGGSVEDSTKLFNIHLNANETVLVEPSYPIVLDTTGDKISVGATGPGGNINFFITGDKEA